jgi:glutamate decarboxylase
MNTDEHDVVSSPCLIHYPIEQTVMSQKKSRFQYYRIENDTREASQDGVGESIEKLFTTSEAEAFRERADEASVSRIVERLLRDPSVTTDIDVASLAERFKQSRVPTEPCDFADYLDYLTEHVIPHSIRTSSPRFIGHMTSALPYFVRPLARLMTAMNQNQVKLETSKALSFYERQSLGMVHRLIFELPEAFYARHIQRRESTLGIITSGGTLANVTALLCARNSCLGPTDGFAGVEEVGLPSALDHYGHTGAAIIGSTQMHYSFEKAAGVLGVGVSSLVKVPVDSMHRIELPALERAIADCRARKERVMAIVGIAGTTESGAVDPLREMAGIARKVGAHFHVDAAWGGPLLFSEQHRRKLEGIEEADSVTIDGHKQMYLPMGIGMVMFRDPGLAKVIEKQARYVVRAGSYDLGARSLEGSRPGMAIFLHAGLNILGHRGYEFLIDEGIRKTRYMADCIRSRAEFELLVEPVINILAYRLIPARLRGRAVRDESDNKFINRFNERLQKLQRGTGHTFVSRTTLTTTRNGKTTPIVALRAVIANPLTTESDIDYVLNHQLQIAATLS